MQPEKELRCNPCYPDGGQVLHHFTPASMIEAPCHPVSNVSRWQPTLLNEFGYVDAGQPVTGLLRSAGSYYNYRCWQQGLKAAFMPSTNYFKLAAETLTGTRRGWCTNFLQYLAAPVKALAGHWIE